MALAGPAGQKRKDNCELRDGAVQESTRFSEPAWHLAGVIVCINDIKLTPCECSITINRHSQ